MDTAGQGLGPQISEIAPYTVFLCVFASSFLFLPKLTNHAEALAAFAAGCLLLGVWSKGGDNGPAIRRWISIALQYAIAYSISLIIIDRRSSPKAPYRAALRSCQRA